MIEKYDRIGSDYNYSRKADPYLSQRLLFHLQVESHGQYLDIGCGTGNYTIALAQAGISFIGVEPAQKMLDVARKKSSRIAWKQGKAEAIPLGDQVVEGAIASLTIHHWTDLQQGFRELYRVIKTQGQLVIFTASPVQMKGYWLCHYFPKMLAQSIEQMPEIKQVLAHLKAVGFKNIRQEKYLIRPSQIDLFLYAGKDRPALYLDPKVRAGISSFADLAHQEEVNRGLGQLTQDLASGYIETVQQQYKNTEGDYLYVIAERD
ncbi:MAG: class I SAM-dependent methyltransferase [Bacteroidota bacterium]